METKLVRHHGGPHLASVGKLGADNDGRFGYLQGLRPERQVRSQRRWSQESQIEPGCDEGSWGTDVSLPTVRIGLQRHGIDTSPERTGPT